MESRCGRLLADNATDQTDRIFAFYISHVTCTRTCIFLRLQEINRSMIKHSILIDGVLPS